MLRGLWWESFPSIAPLTPCHRHVRSPKVKTKKQAKKVGITFALFATRFSSLFTTKWREGTEREGGDVIVKRRPTIQRMLRMFLATPFCYFSHSNTSFTKVTYVNYKESYPYSGKGFPHSKIRYWSLISPHHLRVRGTYQTWAWYYAYTQDSCSSNLGIKEDVFHTHVLNEHFPSQTGAVVKWIYLISAFMSYWT